MKLKRCLVISMSAATALLTSMAAHATVPTNYYNSVDTTNSQTLRTTLHAIIDDHTRIPYTSSATDTWDVLEIADQDPDNVNNVIDVYKNESFVKEGRGNDFYNREHSWPKSYGFPIDRSTNYPYSDIHHLFISHDDYNFSRNDKKYGTCNSACEARPTDANNGRGGTAAEANQTTTGVWETWSGRRGDVARALMYLDVRYAGGNHGVTNIAEPDLILTDDLSLVDNSAQGSNISVGYMGSKSVLIQWHNEDPVDDFERRRNDTIYAYQGNRNPFIDNPQYVSCVFENNCSGGGTGGIATPSNLSATGGQNSIVLAWSDLGVSDLAGYNVYRASSASATLVKLNTSVLNVASFTNSNLADATTYFYAVSAVATDGSESTLSSRVSATTDGGSVPTGTAWINEFHYDNASSDSNEGVEIAGNAGIDLSGWSVEAYNGNGGTVYQTINLSGVIANQQSGFGTLNFPMSGLQNGGSDGLALINDSGNVVQFISYEGTLTATNGAADGLTSTDVSVAESGTTTVNHSLQLVGSGSVYSDFTWQAPQQNTRGNVNTGQSFVGVIPNVPPVAALSYTCDFLNCQFDASSSTDSDGSIVSYQWTFDGQTGDSSVQSSYIFSQAGDYAVTVTVTDDSGDSDTRSQTITVEELISPSVWINEFHYDNSGSDVNEGVEVAGAAGTNLSGWSVVAHNGNGGASYLTINLSGNLVDQQGGFGTAFFSMSGLQNGGSDGLALVDPQGNLVQFISYEGVLTATDDAASGETSEDVGVAESSSTNVDFSLQLVGTGSTYSDFTWAAPQGQTRDAVNTGQTLGDGSTQAEVFVKNANVTLKDRGNRNNYMTISKDGVAGTVQLAVDIDHPWVGDLSLRLYAPDGSYYNVKSTNGSDGRSKLLDTYDVNVSGNASGQWRLRVRDHYWGDVGTLNSWSLTIN